MVHGVAQGFAGSTIATPYVAGPVSCRLFLEPILSLAGDFIAQGFARFRGAPGNVAYISADIGEPTGSPCQSRDGVIDILPGSIGAIDRLHGPRIASEDAIAIFEVVDAVARGLTAVIRVVRGTMGPALGDFYVPKLQSFPRV